VGQLRLVDRDVLELNNLQRQVLYTEQDVADRLPKAVAARMRLAQINSEVAIDARVVDLHPGNAEELVAGVDLVLDGTDNFETRYLLNDVCVSMSLPWIYGGVIGTSGMHMPVLPGRGPCLRCVFPDPPPTGSLPTCDTAGVLNTAPTVVAALQVTDAYRLLTGQLPETVQLHTFDLWTGGLQKVAIAREADCPCCGQGRYDYLAAERTAWTTTLCGRNAVQITPAEPTALDLAQLEERLRTLGSVRRSGHLLELHLAGVSLVFFPDGRVLVQGTNDPAEARSLVARTLGC
jgi:adenylyltransferase/sulfurtransferase